MLQIFEGGKDMSFSEIEKEYPNSVYALILNDYTDTHGILLAVSNTPATQQEIYDYAWDYSEKIGCKVGVGGNYSMEEISRYADTVRNK